MSGHGPDTATFEKAINAELKPEYLADTLAFMFEMRFVCRPTRWALETPLLQHDYYKAWEGLRSRFNRNAP
jgi:homogentisate 1,2-dioxygenase